ncbi:MAG: hypothetical protein E2O79_04865 [Caldithrix sp.]|nr:MAG: hypothetical protein E2O79_04865 [Caldithrix sp.]
MRMKFSWIWVLILLANADFARTTVGGPQEIRFLGYNEQERKVYWLTYFKDASGRLPKLSYIDFSAEPFEPVVDTSWTKGIEPNDRRTFFKRVNAFKSQLLPLKQDMSDSLVVTARIIKITDYIIANDLPSVKQFEMAIMLKSGRLTGTSRITSYINKRIGVSQWYRIPNEQYGIATFSCTGIPWEGGYFKDSVVVLKP